MPRLLVSHAHYPLSVARFFKWAFARLGVPVLSVGPYSPTIPWAAHINYDDWLDKPNIEMPREAIGSLDYVMAHDRVRAFRPDALIQFDAGYRLMGRRPNIPWLHVATDPHVELNYDAAFAECDRPIVMQKTWLLRRFAQYGPNYMPYAFDPFVHYHAPRPREQDVTLITGLMYPPRQQAVAALSAAGIAVFRQAGLIFQQGTEAYLRGRIALNWSSNDDLPMRFWEGLAYRNVVLTNLIQELSYWPEFIEGQDYMAFTTVDECVAKAKWVLAHPDAAEKIARNGYAKVWITKQTYTQRARQLLDIAGLG